MVARHGYEIMVNWTLIKKYLPARLRRHRKRVSECNAFVPVADGVKKRWNVLATNSRRLIGAAERESDQISGIEVGMAAANGLEQLPAENMIPRDHSRGTGG